MPAGASRRAWPRPVRKYLRRKAERVLQRGPAIGKAVREPACGGRIGNAVPAEHVSDGLPADATILIMQRAHAGDQRLPRSHDFWTAVYQAIDD